MQPAWPGCPASDRSDLIGAADRPIWTQSLCHQSVSTSQQRHLIAGVSCRENSPCYLPRCPIHLWLLSGASRVHSCRFPSPRRSCPRRTTKTEQTLNWAEEHKGDRTSEHAWPPGTWSSAPHHCYLFPLVPCHFSICKCLLRAAHCICRSLPLTHFPPMVSSLLHCLIQILAESLPPPKDFPDTLVLLMSCLTAPSVTVYHASL